MYSPFFNLKHKPFQIDTDPRFLWLGTKHKEAFLTLKYGLVENKGLLLLTGDVGTGKTTLINGLLSTLDGSVKATLIRDPSMEPLEFLRYTGYCFGMDSRSIGSKSEFLIQFEEFLAQCAEKKRRVLLIIDEAQRIRQDLLEEIRLLSNIEKNEERILSIFFVGQIEFNETLLRYENRAIRQRISASYNIEPLTEAETREYIRHRLRVSSKTENVGFFSPIGEGKSGGGKSGAPVQTGARLPLPELQRDIFSPEAIEAVHTFSKGFPRLINTICDRALLTGFIENSHTITKSHVEESARELEIPMYFHSPNELSQNRADASPPKATPPPASTPEPRQAKVVGDAEQDSSYDPLTVETSSEEPDQSIRAILDEIDEKLKSINHPGAAEAKDTNAARDEAPVDKRYLVRVTLATAAITIFVTLALYLTYPDAVASFMKEITTAIDNPKVASPPGIPAKDTENQLAQTAAVVNDLTSGQTSKESLPGVDSAAIIFDFPRDADKPSQQTLEEVNALALLLANKPFQQVIITYFQEDADQSQPSIGAAKFHAHFVNSYFLGKGVDAAKIKVRPASESVAVQNLADMANAGHTKIGVDIVW